MQKKVIHDCEAGFLHCVALEKNVVPPIEEWDCKRVQEFLREAGMEDYVNVAKFNKITGEIIAAADREYLETVMGMVDTAHHQRLAFQIARFKKRTWKEINLWAWGLNLYGQCGLPDQSISQPKKVPLPEIELMGDYWLRLSCGRRNTCILSKYGQCWVTGNFKAPKLRKRSPSPEPEEPEEVEQFKKGKGKKGRNKRNQKWGDKGNEAFYGNNTQEVPEKKKKRNQKILTQK